MAHLITILIAYCCFSIGIYIKLKDYGAPKQAFFYAGMIPLLTLIFLLKHLSSSLTNPFQLLWKGFCEVTVLTGLACFILGEQHATISEFLPTLKQHYPTMLDIWIQSNSQYT